MKPWDPSYYSESFKPEPETEQVPQHSLPLEIQGSFVFQITSNLVAEDKFSRPKRCQPSQVVLDTSNWLSGDGPVFVSQWSLVTARWDSKLTLLRFETLRAH